MGWWNKKTLIQTFGMDSSLFDSLLFILFNNMESEINGDQFNSILSNSFSLYQWFQSLHFKDRFKKKLKGEKKKLYQ